MVIIMPNSRHTQHMQVMGKTLGGEGGNKHRN